MEYDIYLERLWQKSLNLTGASYGQFIVFGQLIHTQDSDDILKWFEVLEKGNMI